MKLEFLFIPKDLYARNLRNKLGQKAWANYKKPIIKAAKQICQICNYHSLKSLECHEVWQFNDITHESSLTKCIAICKRCHMTTHMMFTEHLANEGKIKNINIYIDHFIQVNDIDEIQYLCIYNDAKATWQARNKFLWWVKY